MRNPLGHPAALAGPDIDWSGLHRVLAVRPDNLGDVLMMGPALRALKAAAPQARLTLLCSPAGAAVVPLLPEVDDVLVASPAWQHAGPGEGPDISSDADLVRRIAEGRFDAAVVLTSFAQSPWPAAAALRQARVPVRIGTSKEFGGALLTHWVPAPADGVHQVRRALDMLAQVGVPAAEGTDLRVSVPWPAVVAARSARTAAGMTAGEPYAVVMPGASCPSRRWSPGGFAAVTAALAGQGYGVVVAGSAREADLVALVLKEAADPAAVGFAGVLDLPGLAALLEEASVAVVNNSGGMHLADAVRTPMAVLFAGTECRDEYRPRSAPAVLLGRRTECTPCRQFACPFAHECLDVPASEVVAAALSVARPVPAVVGMSA